jgi:hypothetical protein
MLTCLPLRARLGYELDSKPVVAYEQDQSLIFFHMKEVWRQVVQTSRVAS